MWLVHRKSISGTWCLLCAKPADDGHMEGKRHNGRTTDPMWTLRDMGYSFLEWLLQDPTAVVNPATRVASTPTCSEPDHDVTGVTADGTFENKTLGILQIISGMPAWRVFRKSADSDWCLLCDMAVSGGNGHIESKSHLTKEGCPGYWMQKNGFGFLCKTDDHSDVDEHLGGTATVRSASAACGAAKTPWAVNTLEKDTAETRGLTESIYRLTTRTACIVISREDMPEPAVWLAVGRPGYLAFKEDSDGRVMDWTDPFCLLCKCFASYDHVASGKHVERTKAAVYWASLRGYEEVVEWLELNSREVIEIPKKLAAQSQNQGQPGQGFRDSASAALAHWPFSVFGQAIRGLAFCLAGG